MLYSHSRIRCFVECPRCFKYRYVDKVEVEYFETIERFMGCRVHESLEKLYNELLTGMDTPLESVLDYYQSIWSDKIRDEVVVNCDGLTHEDYYAVGQKCIVDYYSRHEPFNVEQTLACELRVDVDLLGDGNYRIIGFIDRVDACNGVYVIHDYKTNRRLPSQNNVEKNRQLALYELGLRSQYNNVNEVEYVWHYLIHDKQLRSNSSPAGLEKIKQDIIKTIHRIEESIVEDWFPAVRTPKCGWCEYQSICGNKKHPVNLKQTLLNAYG